MSDRMRSPRRPAIRSVPFGIGVLLVVCGSVWAGVSAGGSDSWNPSCYQLNNCDSLTFQSAGEMLDRGMSPYRQASRMSFMSKRWLDGESVPFDLPFQYPPNGLPLFAIRAWSEPRIGHVSFAVVSTLVCLFVVLLLVRERLQDPLTATLLMTAVSLGAIVAFNAQLGQTGVVAASLVAGTALSWRRCPFWAGIWVGLLVFKPQYAIPLVGVALLNGHWRVWWGVITAMVASSLLSGIAFGFGLWLDFLTTLSDANHTVPYMVNWMGPFWRFARSETLIQAGALPVFGLGMVVMTGALWVIRKRTSLEGQLAVSLAIAVVVSPNTHPYDLLVLVPALTYVARREGGVGVGPAFFLVTWILLPPPPRWGLAVALFFFAALCVWLLSQELNQAVAPRTGDALVPEGHTE